MGKYLYKPSEAFADKLDNIKRIDPKGYDRIQQVIDRLLTNPGMPTVRCMAGITAG